MTGAPRRDAPQEPPTEVIPVVGSDEHATDRIDRVPAAAEPGEAEPTDDTPQRSTPTLMEQMGGVTGIVYSTVPVLVFVVVNVITELKPALIAAVAAGVAIAILRIVRKERLQPAVSGLLGVAVCAFIAGRTGQARDFYLPGLLYSAGLGLACLVSVVVRWPLAGVIWHGINGEGQSWRRDPRLLRAYTFATALWTVVFAARVVVQGWLYNVDEADWLGVARLLMGYPLLGVALLGTIVAVRRAQRAPAPGST